MADPDSDYAKRLAELVEKFGSQTNALGDAMRKAEFTTRAVNMRAMSAQEAVNRQKIVETELIKTGQKEYKKLTDMFNKGQLTQEELDRAYKKQIRSIENNSKLSDEQKDAMKAAIDVAKARGEAESNAANATEKYSKAVDKASAIFKPAYEAVSGVLSGMRNKDLLGGAGQILQAEVGAAGSAAQGFGKSLTEMAPAAASFGKYGKVFAGLATVTGIGLQALGGAAKGASQVIGPMTSIIQEFSANYTKASQAGVVLAGGMGELRDTAGKAGMRMSDLVDGITSGQEAFQRSGLSVSQATKMVGNFGKGLVEGQDATALFALGYTDAASRVKLAASAYDQARATGMSQADAQKNITALTVEYAKDLKSLQAIVGANAEKELEKGRAEAQRGALMSKLDTDQAKAFEQVYASLDKFGPQADKVRLGLSQLANNGVITDPDILMNKPLMDMLESMNQTIQSGSKDALAKAGAAISKAGDDTRAELKNGGFGAAMDEAGLAMGKNADATVASTTALYNQMATMRLSTDAAEQARKDAEKAAQGKDPATAQMDAITQNQQKLAVALEQAATSTEALKLFGTAVTSAQEGVIKLTEMIKKAARGEDISGEAAKGAGLAAAGALATSAAGTVAGSLLSSALGANPGGGPTPPSGGGGGSPAPSGPGPGGGGVGSKLLKGAKFLGKGAAGVLGGLALDYGTEKLKETGHEKLAAGTDIASDALSWGSTGAMLGSIVPGVGTAIGGGVGALAGGAYGLYKNWDTLFGKKKDTNGKPVQPGAEQTAKLAAEAKQESDRESARAAAMAKTTQNSMADASALDAAEMGMQPTKKAQMPDDGIPTITVGRPQAMGSTALSESLGDMAEVLSQDSAQQQEVAKMEEAKANEEAAKREQERIVFEQMAAFLQQMNDRMGDMVDFSRLTADHTERTARGVA